MISAFVGLVLLSLTAVGGQPMCTSLNVGVTQFELDSSLSFVGHFGKDGMLLFAMSQARILYRSTDGGVTWAAVTPAMLGVPPEDANVWYLGPAADTKPGSSAVKLYLLGSKLWTTTDGLSFKRYDRVPTGLNPHPLLEDVALATFSSDPCTLFITTDFGKTWERAASGANANWINDKNAISFVHSTGCGTTFTVATTTWNAKASPKATDFVHKGLFKSLIDVAHSGYVTTTDDHEQVFLGINDSGELMISRNAKQWIHAFLPGDEGEVFDQFVAYGVDDGSLFVNARSSYFQDLRGGHLFISANDSEIFALSLPYQVRAATSSYGIGGYGDFEKVHSLDGVFLANAFTEVDNGAVLSGVATYITFDMGAKWSRLTAPLLDANGAPTNCSPQAGCYLNLFGLADQHDTLQDWGGFGRFYSVPSAVGIIFATGNLGSALDLTGAVNTYFSNDAGATWQEVRKQRWAYEIADHGSLLALAPRDAESNSLIFSWTEGAAWTACNFTNEPFLVENIITPISFVADSFMLYGEKKRNGAKPVGVLVTLDFSKTRTRTCRGDDAAGSPSSDYELWEVDQGRECQLGMRTQYIRRRANVSCYNDDDHPVNKRQYSVCPCTRDDFECGPCFFEKLGECQRNVKCRPPSMQEQCEQSCYYYDDVDHVKYFRIAGDRCYGGGAWEDHRKLKPCQNRTDCKFPLPSSTSSDRAGGGGGGGAAVLVIFFLLLIGGAVFVVVVCVTKRPAVVYNKLSSLPKPPCCGGGSRYRKLDLGSETGRGDSRDTTSFFDDDELSKKQTDSN